MLRNILDRLFTDQPSEAPLAANDAEMAIAALLVRIARTDGEYSAAEKRRIDLILQQLQSVSAADAGTRRREAEAIEAEAPDTVRFTRLIKDRIPLDDRHAVIGAMWDVALADSERHAEEDSLIRLAARLLGINDRDSALQRQRVVERRAADGH